MLQTRSGSCFFITVEDAPELSCARCLLGDHWRVLSVILFLYSFMIEFMEIQIGATRCHLRPENSFVPFGFGPAYALCQGDTKFKHM